MILIDQRGNRDPYINAAMEDYMVRGMVPLDSLYLLLYINDPCVVVGKNQSIYKEVNFDYLRSGKTLIRRVSGGGTVYHDEGNLCFAFLCSFDEIRVNNYAYFNQPILSALQKAGIDAAFNPRNDIVWGGKKISGNAQFTDRKNIISHGTLLVNSDLDKLRAALKPNNFQVESKSVSSVSSSVMNISEKSDQFKTADSMKDYLIKELPISGSYSFKENEWAEIQKTAIEKFKSNEWLWNRNPATKIIKPGVTIEVNDGVIVSVESKNEKLQTFVGKAYNYASLKELTSEDILNVIF